MSVVIKVMRSTEKLSGADSVSEIGSPIGTDRAAANRALMRCARCAAALQNALLRASADSLLARTGSH